MILLSHLNMISDPRRREGRRFDLPNLLLFTLLAIISGANSYRSISRFMHVRLEWFRSLTGARWTIAPSYTGLRKCLLKLDGKAIETALRAHAMTTTGAGVAQIAIDGKVLRGSLEQLTDKSAMQWVCAFAVDEKVVLGHVELNESDKKGEIRAAQELIETLGLSGTLFTLDALHCQKKHWPSFRPGAMMR